MDYIVDSDIWVYFKADVSEEFLWVKIFNFLNVMVSFFTSSAGIVVEQFIIQWSDM